MPRQIPQQLLPLVLLLLLATAALIVSRRLLIPETFGEYGHYRAAAVDEIRDLEMVYAGYEACLDCHEDVFETKQQSNHAKLSCEVCHGAAAAHVDDPDEFLPDAPRGRGFCPLCHGYNPARPLGFPQIIPERHNPGHPCMTCHEPHNPLLPHKPEECSACHREIASDKMVSHHATVACRRCHEVPDEHLVNPRLTQAERPASKALCGECHAEEAEGPSRVPRIDIATHGERYLCWDCHYPHHPEGDE